MRNRGSKYVAMGLGLAAIVGLTAVRTTQAGEDEGGGGPRDEGRAGDRRDGDEGRGQERGELDWRAVQGFRISPVKLDLHHLSRSQVGLGSYLVNAVASCSDCHTWPNYAPGGNPYLGQPIRINTDHYLAGGRPFGPGLVSPNITPDAAGRPAGLSWHEFKAALRTGHDPDGSGRLLQVMPWPLLSNMLDGDLKALYAYLSAIPHAEPAPPPPAAP